VSTDAPEIGVFPLPAPPVSDELVTVVIPVLDEASWIEECLASVLAQDHEALQVVVVDGGSRDETAELVRDLHASEPRIELLSNPAGLYQSP